MISTYNVNVEAESPEDAANIGMALPIEKWTNPPTTYSVLKYAAAEPIGNDSIIYRSQKWGLDKNRWVQRKRHI
jgi:hypothetical protein